MITAKEVAKWMNEKIFQEERIYQDQIIGEITSIFGEQFTRVNDSGNLAVSKLVLSEFKKLNGKTVVWSQSDRCWRLRLPTDPPDKRSVD